MTIMCAWCKKVLGTKPPYTGKDSDKTTHTICPNCLKEQYGEYKLDGLDVGK